MRQSEAKDTARDEAHASDRLVRHYRKIGAPAVAAALNAGTKGNPDEKADQAGRQASVDLASPAFLDHHAA
jgi:hypothetical protein